MAVWAGSDVGALAHWGHALGIRTRKLKLETRKRRNLAQLAY